MKQLKELTNIITRKKLMKLSILGHTKSSMLDELYLLTAEGKVTSDDEAADMLYGESANFPAYQKLKSKLKGRLVDMLFLVDVDQKVNDDATLAYKSAWRLWSAANLLFIKGGIITGIEYAEKGLELAIAFEHVDLVMQIAKVLRRVYATYLVDKEKFDYYNQLYKEYEEISRAEAKVEEYYERVLLPTVRKVSNNEEIADYGEQLFLELEPMLEKYDQFSIHRFIRYIQVTYLLNKQAYEETIMASQAALDFLNKKTFNLRNTILGFIMHQLVSYTQLRDYENGKEKFIECVEVLGEIHDGSYFKVHELGLILFLHSEHYQDAYDITQKILANPSLKKQSTYTREVWRLYHAYIYYLILVKEITPKKDDTIFTKFRLGRFLNQVPVFSKDKRGMNIPILVIQILFTIALGKYDQAFNRIEAIEKYTSRYIRRDDHYRSNCFIKMLLQIPIAGFQQKLAEDYADKYYQKLESVSLEVANQPHEIEIIPYDKLWNLSLKSLK